MGELSTKSNDLTTYIREVESKERAGKRIVFFSIGGILTVAAAGVASFIALTPDKSARKVAYDDLSLESVSAMFEANPSEVIVEYSDQLPADTIHSVDEYIDMLALEESNETKFEPISPENPSEEFLPAVSSEAVQKEEAVPEGNATNSVAQYRFVVEGDREAGQELMFAIQRYSDKLSYRIDFGNGVTQKTGRFTRYVYPRPGRFLVSLVAENETGATSTFSRFIEVSGGSAEVMLASTEEIIAVPTERKSEQPEPSAPVTDMRQALSAEKQNVTDLDDSEEPLVTAASRTAEEEPESIQAAPSTPFTFTSTRTEAMLINYQAVCQKMKYPADAANAGIEGIVQVRVLVSEKGAYVRHELLSSPSPILTEAIRPYVRKLQFEPATEKGKKTTGWVSIPFVFKLQQ